MKWALVSYTSKVSCRQMKDLILNSTYTKKELIHYGADAISSDLLYMHYKYLGIDCRIKCEIFAFFTYTL